MAVNPPPLGELLPVAGIGLGAAAAEVKYSARDDIAVILLAEGTTTAGVFTQSHFRAPPVDIAERRLRAGGARALLINSGNANAATGELGTQDALALCEHLASKAGVSADSVLPFSTGVIGERLPVDQMRPAIDAALATATSDNSSEEGAAGALWEPVARAIMTTDTVPKVMSLTAEVAGSVVTFTGMTKGAGMMKPDMATMLAFVCCDAAVAPGTLQDITRHVADRSFNRISVDGDTSTNDSFVVAATGKAGNKVIDGTEVGAVETFAEALTSIAEQLAQWIIRDAEGATKFVTVRVQGGATNADCLEVAYTIAESPLVKTALFAGDPNWGRICMAIGRAKVTNLEASRVSVDLNHVPIARNGMIAPSYLEAEAAAVMEQDEFEILVDLGLGDAQEVVWTSDLSYEYVRVNAEYRT